MSVYRELDPMAEHKTQFAFTGKREHISKVNILNTAYPRQHIDIEIPHGSRDHVIVPGTVKITFNLDTETTDKARSVVNNVGRALVKKKVLMLGSTDIDTINNSDIRTKSDGTELTLTTQENAIKKTFANRSIIPLDFDFFKHPVYPDGLKERLIVRLELNSSEKVILRNGDTSATYKLSDISLEYDTIFDEPYATTIGEMYAGTSIPYVKVTSVHYQTLKKKRRYLKY